MRYVINFDKTINQFVPHYLGGRKLILYLQALMKPIQQLNDKFSEWAKETRIEASMTSQIFKVEWFLDRKMRKYFNDPNLSIYIENASTHGLPIYHQNANIPGADNLLLRIEGENSTDTAVLSYEGENTIQDSTSFVVYAPEANTELISEKEYKAMLSYWVDRYRIATKTYNIILYNNTNEGI